MEIVTWWSGRSAIRSCETIDGRVFDYSAQKAHKHQEGWRMRRALQSRPAYREPAGESVDTLSGVAPRAVAPGAPARGLSFWRWFRCGRIRLGCALTAASGDSSSGHDHSPGSRPRRLGARHRWPCRALTGADSFLHCHQRRHSAPGLRAGRNRPTREDGLRPCFMKTTDQPNGPAPGRRRPEFPVSSGRGALRRVLCSANLDERPDCPAPRIAHRDWRGRTCRCPAGRGHDELQRARSPRRRRTASP